ncbi:MAG: flavodoxin family protein [Clostridia bacterium]|nr:flavodoxin family protein [Clostridia bacterium]
MKIVAVNGSPRKNFNTAELVKAIADGARSQGAEVEVINLYDLDGFTGCISCFGCKLGANRGRCVRKDGLSETLEKIRNADGLVLGTPNYLGETSAGFRALYERLIFQYLTYQKEEMSCNDRKIPVIFVMTSNAPDFYYRGLVKNYKNSLSNFIGPTKTFVVGDTKQVKDYSIYNWTMFDTKGKDKKHEMEFPKELEKARKMGEEMVRGYLK